MKRPRLAIQSFSGLLLAGAVLFQITLLTAQAPSAGSGQAIPIAVMDFDGFGISQVEAIALSNRLRNELFRLGAFEVVDRGMMENILTEQDFQMVGCTSNECLVEVGQLLGAKQMIGGSISKVGAMFTVSARVVDVETGKMLGVSDFDLRGGLEEVLTTGMKQVAVALSESVPEKEAPPVEVAVIDQAVPDEESSDQVTSPAEKEAPPPQQTETVLQSAPAKARSQPTLVRRIISKLSIGSGHAKTVAAGTLDGRNVDMALSIDFGQPSAHEKNIQYGIMIGFIDSRYYGLWPSGSPFINDKVDRSRTFVTEEAGHHATFDDLTDLDAYGTLFYGMAMVSRSFGWDQGFYGFKLFAAGGLCLGQGTIRYYGEKGEYWDEWWKGYYTDYFYEYDYYDVADLMYTLGGQLRLGYPRFSVILGAKLTREPIVGLKPYLSAGILWPL